MRVLDLADEKGELCGRLLADLGADVIRLEPPEGAISRTLSPFAPGSEVSLYFAVRNAGKRGAVVDLTTDAGQARLHALLADADLLVESTRPGKEIRKSLSEHQFRQFHTRRCCLNPRCSHR